MPNELPGETYLKVQQMCQEGDVLADQALLGEAVSKYEEALGLLPMPISQWEASTWILTAIGDACFHMKDYQKAVRSLLDAMNCPGALGNPFIHLRLGQVQLELGNDILAKDELARAYMGGGKEVFHEEDPKYFELVKTTLRKPPSGW